MIPYDLTRIRAVVFDIDGVLSPSTMPLGADGQPSRMVNVKDGYAMQLAVKKGLKLAIISGAKTPVLAVRYSSLGLDAADIMLGASTKLPLLEQWTERHGIAADALAYVGDDIPDLPCMHAAGLAVAPADAAQEALEAATYISPRAGGCGVAREVIEQVLKAKGLWLDHADAFGW